MILFQLKESKTFYKNIDIMNSGKETIYINSYTKQDNKIGLCNLIIWKFYFLRIRT